MQATPRPTRPIFLSSLVTGLMIVALSGDAPPAFADKPAPPPCTPQVPCADARGCPDLAIDPGILAHSPTIDFHTFAPTDCAVVEGMATEGTRKLLLFSTQSNNLGPGALFLGSPAEHPDWFVFSACHGHYHIKDYADYRLWTLSGYARWKALRAADPSLCASQVLAANPDLASELVLGTKLGLCFYDVLTMHQAPAATQVCPNTLDPQTYTSCDFAGLGVCWADIYSPVYGVVDGQWIDVTGIPNGDYVLENESNATHLITETDYSNNSSAVVIQLRHNQAKVLSPA